MNMEKKLRELLKQADLDYKKRFGNDKEITRDFFRPYLARADISEHEITEIWGSFSNFKQTLSYKRQDISIVKNDADKSGKRRYFITSFVVGAKINTNCFKTVQTFCKKENAQLILIIIRGVEIKQQIEKKEYDNFKECFATEYFLNENLVAKDFYIDPQQIDPTTGINRYGNKTYSVIIGSPKQILKPVPSKHGEFPHLIYSTGTICDVEYKKSKTGVMAEQDEQKGGLIVEIENHKFFHIRNVQFDNGGGFCDLNKYYQCKKVKKIKTASIIWGDIHYGMEDKTAESASEEMSGLLNVEKIVIHDLFNAASVMRHNRKDMISRLHRENYEKILKLELDYVGHKLHALSQKFKKSTIYIVSSNHDRHLNDYLSRGEWIEDENNFVLACELFLELYKDKNPIEYYIRKNFKIDNVVFLKQEENLIIGGFQCAKHGDQGNTGAKGNIKSLEIAFPCSVIGNYHAPAIYRQIYQVGCLCKLDPEYTIGYASASMHANCIIHKNKTRQMILIINGKYKI